MASEIRANKQTNRVGLGTVTYTDTGIIVSGIVTANSFKGDGSQLTGVDSTALKDTAGNVKVQANSSGIVITGVTTTGAVSWGGHMLPTSNAAYDIGSADYKVRHLFLSDNSLKFVDSSDTEHPLSVDSGRLKFAGGLLLGNTIKVDEVSGIITATSFSGDGSGLSNLPASAPVGGASTNTVFFENDKAVAVNYQITSTKNAMSAGPISINAGIAVTVPSGCSWTIV